jgi:hypothetical protein
MTDARKRPAREPPPARGSGALLFARYAYPPNVLGYCGPEQSDQILEQASAGVDDPGLRGLLRGFEGAWPYLELIAGSAGIPDPLDARVVEAYWLGNDLLDRVGMPALGHSLEDRFRGRVGAPAWSALVESIPAGAVPHHSLHVFAVYPWTGLLRAGRGPEPLQVLERCRIRWGRVLKLVGGTALVRSQPLAWDGRRLSLGPARVEEVRVRDDRGSLVAGLAPGDWCALHWDWACDRLDPPRLAALRRWSAHTLDLVNALPHPAPATVLG